MNATVAHIAKLQKMNPYYDDQSFESEMEGVKELTPEQQKEYLSELKDLVHIYKWHAHKMPKGTFFGLA